MNTQKTTFYYFAEDFGNQNYKQNGNIAAGEFMVPLYKTIKEKEIQGYISFQSLGFIPSEIPFSQVKFDVQESITITFNNLTFLGAALRNLPGGFYEEFVCYHSCHIGCDKKEIKVQIVNIGGGIRKVDITH